MPNKKAEIGSQALNSNINNRLPISATFWYIEGMDYIGSNPGVKITHYGCWQLRNYWIVRDKNWPSKRYCSCGSEIPEDLITQAYLLL